MDEVGVVLRVPESTHSKLRDACAEYDRSMQKILMCLIKNWIEDGAPDPYSPSNPHPVAVLDLSIKIRETQRRLDKLESYLFRQ